MDRITIKKRDTVVIEDLKSLSKEQLIERVQALHAHNIQLKNVIAKSSVNKKRTKRDQKPFDFNNCHYRHVLLKFFYLGWNYQGYTVQEDTQNTVEHHLFEALTRTCLVKDRCAANYHRCGRTDKGVSSFGQVISIDLRSKFARENQHKLNEEINYCKILNNVLPKDIRCVAWSPASEDFSSRFDCRSRTYKYFFPRGRLNITNMTTASNYLVGTHDFRNFCKMDVGNGVVEFVRNITSIEIVPFCDEAGGDEYCMFVAVIRAKAFLWHQIRCIMGILFLIGEGKEQPDVVKKLLDVEENPRKPDYNMASEIPLNLYCCEYDEDIEWYYDYEVISSVLEKLRTEWMFGAIKATMIRSMIDDLQLIAESCVDKPKGQECSTTCLIQGVKSKTYIPVMRRQRCDSLEDRIKHFSKRSRIEIKGERS